MEERAEHTVTESLRILVADDDAWIRNLLVRVLADAGHCTHSATNGTEALSRLSGDGYDLAILDVQMSGMSGVEITRRYKQNRGNTPLIVLTADATPETAAECYEAGVSVLLTKPVRVDELLRTVGAFARTTERTAVRMHMPAPDAVPDFDGDFDSHVLDRVAETCGHNFLKNLLEQFNAQAATLLTELKEAHSAKDFALVDELLHKLEGSAGTVGAIGAARTASDLRRQLHGPSMAAGLDGLQESIRKTATIIRRKYEL